MTPFTRLGSQDSSLVLSDSKVLTPNRLDQPWLTSGCSCSHDSEFLL